MFINKALCLFICLFLSESVMAQEFKAQQMQNGRVINAYEEKGEVVRKLLTDKNLDTASLEIFIRAFKEENKLEVWGRDSMHIKFQLIKTYRICRISGTAGPKRRQGDRQIPEGFYHVDRYNPWSSFHLSLGINYPNASDRVLSDRRNPGGDIFIHGSCVTIGCLPMTDEKIKEIYILAVEARNSGQESVPVHIFPIRMLGESYTTLLEEHSEDEALIAFWTNLEEGFLYFELNKILPDFIVDNTGRYCFK